MYTTYRNDELAQPKARTSVFVKEDAYAIDAAQYNNMYGRILTYCVAGTFGLLSPSYLLASTATSNWSINQIEIAEKHKVPVEAENTAARDIAHIRDAIKISISELARVFGVSRQAVHEWIKGGALSSRNSQRLSELAQVADILLEARINVTPQVLRRKVSNGRSILESIGEDGNIIELAHKLVDTLSRESQQRQSLATRLAGRQRPALTAGDFGAPHLNEDA